MNLLLWIAQVLIAFMAVSGSVYRVKNYADTLQAVASVKAMPYGFWVGAAVFEIVCAAGLILPGLLKARQPNLTAIAAGCLAVEMALMTGLHLRYFGLDFRPTNPAVWTAFLAALCTLVAWGRASLKA